MRVLFLPLYSSLWASSRYRAYLWAEALGREGFRCRVLAPPVSPASRASYYARLFAFAPMCDVVFVQKKLFPVPLLGLLRRLNPRLVFDFDDALFARPTDLSEEAFAEGADEGVRRLDETLRTVSSVVAGNRYLAEYAQAWNPHVTVIPTAIDLDRLPPMAAKRTLPDRVVIGWTGRSATLVYLDARQGLWSPCENSWGSVSCSKWWPTASTPHRMISRVYRWRTSFGGWRLNTPWSTDLTSG